jgi:hypothetical protein
MIRKSEPARLGARKVVSAPEATEDFRNPLLRRPSRATGRFQGTNTALGDGSEADSNEREQASRANEILSAQYWT